SSVTYTTVPYTLSLHDALPISVAVADDLRVARRLAQRSAYRVGAVRTMQRAPVTNFGEQCVWTRRNHVSSINLRCSKPARVSRRSEEHTSELQSPYDLVCRLLL